MFGDRRVGLHPNAVFQSRFEATLECRIDRGLGDAELVVIGSKNLGFVHQPICIDSHLE